MASGSARQRVNIMLDAPIVEHFKHLAGERGYQILINDTLRRVIEGEHIKSFPPYPRLEEIVDLLQLAKLPPPFDADEYSALNPCAVELRHDGLQLPAIAARRPTGWPRPRWSGLGCKWRKVRNRQPMTLLQSLIPSRRGGLYLKTTRA